MKQPETLNAIWLSISTGLEIAGVAVVVVGALATTVIFAWQSYQQGGIAAPFTQYRRSFGKAILLGLEFLVAADIVGTVAIGPTLQDLSVLGLLVLIRTFLSFSLEMEITGRWPWQTGKPES